jgi:hypothetical protein
MPIVKPMPATVEYRARALLRGVPSGKLTTSSDMAAGAARVITHDREDLAADRDNPLAESFVKGDRSCFPADSIGVIGAFGESRGTWIEQFLNDQGRRARPAHWLLLLVFPVSWTGR